MIILSCLFQKSANIKHTVPGTKQILNWFNSDKSSRFLLLLWTHLLQKLSSSLTRSMLNKSRARTGVMLLISNYRGARVKVLIPSNPGLTHLVCSVVFITAVL